MWECPDFFPLDGKQVLLFSPQEVKAKDREFHNGNCPAVIIGDYDKELPAFTREGIQAIDYGLDFYAPQTLETEDGRRIMIGWLQSWDNHLYPHSMGWSGSMSIPRELKINQGRLYQTPVKEIANYYTDSISYKDIVIDHEIQLEGIKGRKNDLTVQIHGGDYKSFQIRLACGGSNYSCLNYDRDKKTFTIDREFSGLARDVISSRTINVLGDSEDIKLRILMDQYSIEVFLNNGRQVMSMLIYTETESDGIIFEAEGLAIIDVEYYKIEG
jgi:beta-fructofuranosidase